MLEEAGKVLKSHVANGQFSWSSNFKKIKKFSKKSFFFLFSIYLFLRGKETCQKIQKITQQERGRISLKRLPQLFSYFFHRVCCWLAFFCFVRIYPSIRLHIQITAKKVFFSRQKTIRKFHNFGLGKKGGSKRERKTLFCTWKLNCFT